MIPDHIIECAARAVHEKHGQHIAPRYMDAPTWYRDDLEAQIATALEAVAADIWEDGYEARQDEEASARAEYGTTFTDIISNPYRASESA